MIKYKKIFDKKEDNACRTPYIKQLMMVQVSKPPKDIFPSLYNLQCHQELTWHLKRLLLIREQLDFTREAALPLLSPIFLNFCQKYLNPGVQVHLPS